VSDSPLKSFGARLRVTREGENLSQSELAERAGLTPAAVSQIESGERLPAFKTLTQLAAALKTSVSFLLGESGTDLPPKLKAMFRDLEALSAKDVDKVRDYAAYLRAHREADSK